MLYNVKNIRMELFSLNNRLQVGNYFCGGDSNSVPEMVVGNVVVFYQLFFNSL